MSATIAGALALIAAWAAPAGAVDHPGPANVRLSSELRALQRHPAMAPKEQRAGAWVRVAHSLRRGVA
ncbi:MAG TPA: hypothetical protein VKA21_03040, partial [Candidatus Binatia bacterium]|nr:hypothetical protein [Candidatus Binatia bacterium]